MSQQLSFLDARAERDRILDVFQKNHATYLEALRAFARDICRQRGVVCIDDVRAELERRDFPMPKEIGADERIFGALFCKSQFKAVGSKRTARKEWAQRVGVSRCAVTVYELRSKAA